MAAERIRHSAARRGRPQVRRRARLVVTALLAAGLVPIAGVGAASAAPTLPEDFTDTVVASGFDVPTVVAQAADGRIFVAEKAGTIKVMDGWDDTSPTVFADLTAQVYDDHDRGLLGMALAPDFPTDPSVYVLYSHETEAGSDGRLSRLRAAGDVSDGTETLLVQGWCEQYNSHSIGALAFGADGALYATGGDGASYSSVDVGDFGNPCQDPPTPGSSLSAPDAQGGALRSQSPRRPDGPVILNGTVIRVDPATGDGLPDNPMASHTDANARRIIAYGLRNPFRFALRPGTKELYVGDTGWNSWEEINRIADTSDGAVENFGWPCYEGATRQGDYDSRNLTSCETLYDAGPTAVAPPFVAKGHSGSDCTGANSMTGAAFHPASGGSYPAAYAGAFFYSDYSRNCIWVVRVGAGGALDASTDAVFATDVAGPTSITTLPGGDLVYTSYNGSIHRISYTPPTSNRAPTAAVSAEPTSGPSPLTVDFDGRGSTDPDGDALTYSWDLDGDGTFGDATTATARRTYETAGRVTVQLRVTDAAGATDTESVVVDVGVSPPTASIQAPETVTVGDTVAFTGTGTSGDGTALPASAYSWSVVVQHCRVDAPTECHEHPDAFSLDGQTSGSFTMPDHERFAYLELRLTVTDGGLSTTVSHRIDYTAVTLSFASQPAGVSLSVGGLATAAPFTRDERVGGTLSIGAPETVTIDGKDYRFESWSDGGAAGHNVTVPAEPTTYTAVYVADDTPAPGTQLFADLFESGSATAWTPSSGTWSVCRPPGNSLEYCVADARDSTSLAGSADWRDYSVESAVRIAATAPRGHGACVLGRVQDATHYYQLELKPDPATGTRMWWIWKRDGGSWQRIASGAYAYELGRYYHLRLEMKGSTLTAAVSSNGGGSFSVLGSGTDGRYATGRIGLRSWGAATTFDVVRVRAL